MPNVQKTGMVKVSQKNVDFAQAKAIVKLNRKVSKLVKANKSDSHFVDVAQTLTPGTTPALGYLVPVAQGDGENNRDGDAISLRHLSWKATLVPNASASSDACRIIIFRARTGLSGTPPPLSTILEVNTNIDSPYNRDYRNSYVILYDKKIDISQANGTKHLKFNTLLNNTMCTFTSTGTTHYNENNIWFYYLFSDNTNKAAINYYSRVTFSP